MTLWEDGRKGGVGDKTWDKATDNREEEAEGRKCKIWTIGQQLSLA